MPEANTLQALLAAHVRKVRNTKLEPLTGSPARYTIIVKDEKTGRVIVTPMLNQWLKESRRNRRKGSETLGTLLKGLFVLLERESRKPDRRKFI